MEMKSILHDKSHRRKLRLSNQQSMDSARFAAEEKSITDEQARESMKENSLCPSLSWIDREGQSFWFFHVVRQLNNKNRWRAHLND